MEAVRNIELDSLLEAFLVSAVAAVLSIRLFLHLTGYPQLGGKGLHIAHMLWGGLLMVIAIVILLAFLSHASRRLAAVAGGVGFGIFVDELGKFITSDNNYFYQPAVSLIYVLFVALYLSFRLLERSGFSEQEYLVNSLELAKEAVLRGLDRQQLQRALAYLDRSDPQSEVTALLRRLYGELHALPPQPPSRLARLRTILRQAYLDAESSKRFPDVVIAAFLAEAVLSLVYVAFVGGPALLGSVGALGVGAMASNSGLHLHDVLSLLSSGVAVAFVIWGATKMRRSRMAAYRAFRHSLLVSILVGQVFLFYAYQVGAVLLLFVNIVLLAALSHMIEQERKGAEVEARS
jgi:hypothetical protein